MALQITMREIPNSPALENQIHKRYEKLQQFCKRIVNCRIVIELVQKHKHQGKLFRAKVEVTIPRKELQVTHKLSEDVWIAVRDAFDAVTRQLEELMSKRNGRIKTHSDLLKGEIVRKLSKEGYGFIEGVDGNEYYFSITNVSYPNFEQLHVGDIVAYHPKTADEGLHAHHVTLERCNSI